VELGQLLVLALIVPVLELLFRFVVAERIGTIILSALVAHTGWHWMTERFGVLRQFPWPVVTAAGMATTMRWLMALVALAALVWLAALLKGRFHIRIPRRAEAASPCVSHVSSPRS